MQKESLMANGFEFTSDRLIKPTVNSGKFRDKVDILAILEALKSYNSAAKLACLYQAKKFRGIDLSDLNLKDDDAIKAIGWTQKLLIALQDGLKAEFPGGESEVVLDLDLRINPITVKELRPKLEMHNDRAPLDFMTYGKARGYPERGRLSQLRLIVEDKKLLEKFRPAAKSAFSFFSPAHESPSPAKMRSPRRTDLRIIIPGAIHDESLENSEPGIKPV
jgi:hypothetical protein